MGDPVQIARQRDRLIIRYYPTGLITEPNDRVRLEGSWCAADQAEVTECQTVAEELRRRLYAHRAAHGHHTDSSRPHPVRIREAVPAFLTSIEGAVASATIKAHKTKLNVLLIAPFGDRDIAVLPTIVNQIVTLMDGPRADRTVRSINTREGYRSTLAAFGEWLARTHRMPDPFAGQLPPIATKAARKELARSKIHRADPFGRSETVAISLDDIPCLDQVLALRDAVLRRETSGPPVPGGTRGRQGGAKPLARCIARQIADAVTTSAATGTREGETLVLHTSRIHLSSGRIVIDRQLDRDKPWLQGEDPPMVPPKHETERTTLVWPSFLPRLRELCAHADEHNNGWLFMPTRGQRDWFKGFESMLKRAKDLLDFEHEEWARSDRLAPEPLRFPFTFHDLRHAYASYSLTPSEADGLGWSISLVQRCLGHASVRTTQEVYQHITDLEFRYAVDTPHHWPGLNGR